MKKNILVTGGAGFIGSHLCEQLVLKGGYEVTSLDNYSSGSVNNHVKGVEYIKGSTEDIRKLFGDRKFDCVVHLGEYSRVEQSFNDFQLVWNTNKLGTFEVLKFCKDNNSKLVYAGSSTKFSDGDFGRYQSPYAWAKSSNTELIKAYSTWYGLNYAITYFYNAYGPREILDGNYATLIGIFSKQFKNKTPLTVVSPGTQKRNFTHVLDIVAGLILVVENGQGDEFGIGADESYSVLTVARMFGGEIEMLPERKGNRLDGDLLTSKIKKMGWVQKFKLKNYINSLID